MRIYLSAEGRTVQLSTSPKERIPLEAAEAAALRLLKALPNPAAEPEKSPIGFAGPVESDIERAPAPESATDDEDDDA
ncbi:hypothetical protein [Streptomyces zaomyceticus]|uniref:hypothetical protein n=1 Tax=Streptomyces zaomyceticus TaxID=68286 RepID=UPI0037A52708